MLRKISNGILAGIMISIGGCVYLSCDDKYIGAVLFSVALLSICYKGFALFTGKVGYIVDSHDRESVSELLFSILGNAIATVICGYMVIYAIPALSEKANAICSLKLTQAPLQTFIRGLFCGILMFLAVNIYRENKTVMGILFCVPVFILSGFEHSIANMFYFALSEIVSLKAFIYLLIVIIGNSAGGILIPLLCKIGKGR